MMWFNRITVLAAILCLSHAPIPWAHRHLGLNAEQLASHLREYHPATSDSEVPQGWHWHVVQLDVTTNGEHRDEFVTDSSNHSRFAPVPESTSIVSAQQTTPGTRSPIWMNGLEARAVYQQRSYLRLNVLLI